MPFCPFCDSEQFKITGEVKDIFKDSYKIANCKNCNTRFLNPSPNDAQLREAYNEDYYGFGEHKFPSVLENIVSWFRSLRARKLASFLDQPSAILDFGCGNGQLLNQLSKFNSRHELFGLELEGKSASRAQKNKNLNIHIGALEVSTYQKDQFKLIALIHVLEHVPNPKKTLELLFNSMKKDSFMVIEIPNINSLQFKLFKGNWFHMDPPRHLNMIPEKTLESFVEQLGLTCISKSYFSPVFSPYGAIQSSLNVLGFKRDALYEFLKGNKDYCKNYPSWTLYLMLFLAIISYPFFFILDAVSSVLKKGATVRWVLHKD